MSSKGRKDENVDVEEDEDTKEEDPRIIIQREDK